MDGGTSTLGAAQLNVGRGLDSIRPLPGWAIGALTNKCAPKKPKLPLITMCNSLMIPDPRLSLHVWDQSFV